MTVEALWEGAIPLKLTLAETEISTLPPPEPLYVMAPRMSYLPLLAKMVYDHFQEVLPPGESKPWFEFEGLPLKWSVPTGVLYDLFSGRNQLPWNLTVHFRSYPSDVLLPCDDESVVRAHFFNSLKEATCITHGSASSVMQLSSSAQNELWQSVSDGGSLATYTRGIATLPKLPNKDNKWCGAVRMYCSPDDRVGREGAGAPLEGMTPGMTSSITPGMTPGSAPPRHIRSWDDVVCTSRPFDLEEDVTTLGDVVRSILARPARSDATNPEDAANSSQPWFTVSIQGIAVPLETLFAWLCVNMCHPDQFVHICVRHSFGLEQ
mmetsp:Transcript_14840/g.25122  ORF Transcript_14840/g.25122 Transcript_14840/m.25122 type:complete len:321 (-) Transcript_14840:324-1286(-)